MKLEEQIDLFMKSQVESSSAWIEMHERDRITPDDVTRLVQVTVGVHRKAILRLAREIDNLSIGQPPDA